MNDIIHGDCLEVMKTFPENHFSAIVTDPPYGLHFMGKDWDCYGKGKIHCGRKIPGTHTNSEAHESARYDTKRDDEFERFMFETARESLRILKPGSHVLMFGAPRRYHRQVCALEDAGFEIRDCLMWIFGSGFPKSHNRFGIDGFGTALKPAYEPIIMAMKPCDGTFKQNAEKWGQAGINIDGCRIPTKGELVVCERARKNLHEGWDRPYTKNEEYCISRAKESNEKTNSLGRWPANVILDEEAATQLGEPSRFFYCAKTSSKERKEGLGDLLTKETHRYGSGLGEGKDPSAPAIDRNNHPTVKPLKLMEYLIKLVMPPKNGILLDPFAGSGSTLVAAKRLGFEAIGIEKFEDYVNIARARIDFQEQDDQIDMFMNEE